MQGQDLGPDDFGGEALEGCNEHLVLTRPDLVARDARRVLRGRRRRGRDRDVRRVPARAQRVRHRRQDVRDEPARRRASPARSRPATRRRRPPPLRDRLDRSRHPAPVARPDPVRRAARRLRARRSTACSRAASTCCSSRPSTTCSQAKAAINGARARDARARVVLAPDHGAGHGRDDGPHARRHRDRRRAHRARSDAARRDRHELRDRSGRDDRAPALPRAARAHVPVGAAERGAAVGRRRPHALRPHARRARRGARAVRRPSSASTSSAAAAARRPSTSRRSSSGSAPTRAPVVRTPEFEPGCSSIYSHVPFHQELAYLAVGERTNANGSRKFRDAMLEADWDTCVQMAREQVKEGAHVLDVCVDYVGRDGTHRHGRDRGPVRDAGVAAARVRLDRAAGARSRPAAPRRQGDPQLGQPRRGRGRGQAHGPRVPARARVRRGGHLPHDRRRRPGPRPPTGSCGSRKRIYDIAIERYGLEPTDLIFDALTFPLSTGDDDLRRDAMETIEAIRRIKAELPGASTILGLSNVSFGLKPAARHVLNSVFLHECREAGLDAAIVHAARIVPLQPHRRRASARSRSTSSTTAAATTTTRSPSSWRCSRASRRARSRRKTARAGRSTERLKHRIIDGDRDGLEADLDEQLATLPALEIVNDVLLDGMKVVGELFGTRPDAAAVRAAVGRDDEGRGRVPRAAHGEGRRRRQGHGRARHRQGRRARHRQEPRRHHPHQQRLHGLQPRHQGRDHRDDREGARGRTPTRSA